MPRPPSLTPPKYTHHKASGQACVYISRKPVYLGVHGSKESRTEYDRVISRWLANGRQLPPKANPQGAVPMGLTVVELIDQYREWSLQEYGDTPAGEHRNTMDAVAPVKRLFGRLAAAEFGPNALREVRQQMIDGTHRTQKEGGAEPEPLSRTTVNDRVHRIRRVFRWAVSRELVPPAVIEALDAVDAIRIGRGQAKETAPVKPVSDAIVTETLRYLPEPRHFREFTSDADYLFRHALGHGLEERNAKALSGEDVRR